MTFGGLAVAALIACGSGEDGGEAPELADAGDGGVTLDAMGPEPAAPDSGTDAPTDAPQDVDGAGPPFCATQSPAPKFCADFDDPNPGAAWTTKTEVPNNSTVGIDTTVSKSGPASLRGESRALLATEPGNAALRKTFLVGSTHVRLAFSGRWSATTFGDGMVAIANVDVAANRFFTLYLRNADPGTAVLEEIDGATTTLTPLAAVPAVSTWTRVELDLDLANGKATVRLDGAKVAEAATGTAAATEVSVRIGNVYVTGPLPKLVGNYDDVTLDY